MKDIEFRLKQLETVSEEQEDQQTMQRLKEKLHPVMADIEKRLIALETRPVETSMSSVSFAEENPTTLTKLVERVQVLESSVNNLEPSNSSLHSSISSTPLEPPEDNKKCRGFCSLTVEVSGKGPDALHVFGLPDRVSSGAPFVLSRSDGGRLAVVSA